MTRYFAMSIALCAWSATACTHSHLPRNAPGHVRVEVPPENMANPEPELPEDPGERMLIVSYGVFAGGGVLAEEDADLAGDYGLGPEISVELGDRNRSHFQDDFFVLPDRSLGLRFGLNVLDSKLEPPGAGFSEFAYTDEFVRAGAGWAWDADDARHGPHATLAAGPFFVRGMHLLDYGTSVHAGLLIGGSHAWIWSR